MSDYHKNNAHRIETFFPSTTKLKRKRNSTFPLLPSSIIDAEFGFFSCARRVTLADEWINASTKCATSLKAEDGISVAKTALSLATSTEEYLAVLLREFDALFKYYPRLYVRKWRLSAAAPGRALSATTSISRRIVARTCSLPQ